MKCRRVRDAAPLRASSAAGLGEHPLAQILPFDRSNRFVTASMNDQVIGVLGELPLHYNSAWLRGEPKRAAIFLNLAAVQRARSDGRCSRYGREAVLVGQRWSWRLRLSTYSYNSAAKPRANALLTLAQVEASSVVCCYRPLRPWPFPS